MKRKKNQYKVGYTNSKQKSISNNLIKDMERFKRYLQTRENIKYGRKAKTISFLYASSKPKQFANFVLGVKRK